MGTGGTTSDHRDPCNRSTTGKKIQIIVIVLTQIPRHSTITTYQENQRTYRRHISSTYDNYWETGLKEATYRTFLRKGYADPSLKDQILNAPLTGAHNQQATPFGDIAVLGRGQLYFSAGGFLFVQDEYSYDCDECGVRRQSYHNHGQIVALWTVTRLRHHDKAGFYRYETEYLISPINSNNYLKRNGAFDYDIPGFVFILKTNQPEVNSFKNYLKPTPAWYNEDKSDYLNSKQGRRYLPPGTTTTAFYYTTPKTFYQNNKERHHHYDPDIVPARNNVEKEIELYKKLLQSLKSAQTSTSSTLPSTSKTPTSGYYFINRVTPTIPLTTSTAKMLTTSIRFPNITPFKPSPMYTKYSEPDPLYTTTTPSVTNTPYRKPIIDTTTRRIVYPKPTQTTLVTPLTTTNFTEKASTNEINYSNTIFSPQNTLTNKLTTTTTLVPTSKTTQITISPAFTTQSPTEIPSTETSPSSSMNIQGILTSTPRLESQSIQTQFTPYSTQSYLTSQSININKISTTLETSSPKPVSTSTTVTQTNSNISFFQSPTPTSPTTMTTTTKKKLMLTTSSEFNIFSIFDKPQQEKEIKMLAATNKPQQQKEMKMLAATNIKEMKNLIKPQNLSPDMLSLTTPSYAETNQASSIIFSVVKNNTPTSVPSTENVDEDRNITNNLYSKEISTTVEISTDASITEPTPTVSNIDEHENKKKPSVGELLKKIGENTPTSKTFEETTLEETINTSDTTTIKRIIQTETTKSLRAATEIPTTIMSTNKIYKDTTMRSIREHITMADSTPYETTITTFMEPQYTEKWTVATEQNILKKITPTTIEMIESLPTKKIEIPISLATTNSMPTLNTTPRIRKYQYTKIPRRKTTKTKKVDAVSSSRSPAVYRTREPRIHETGLKLNLSTTINVPSQTTQELTTTPYPRYLQTTNAINDNQDTTTEPFRYKSAIPKTTSSQSFPEETTTNMDVITGIIPLTLPPSETTTQKTNVSKNKTNSNNFTEEHLNETMKNTIPKESTTPMPINGITTPTSAEIFNELFGSYSRELPTMEPPVTKKMNKNSANDRELEEELFGIIGRSSNSIENIEHPTQIEESTTEIQNTPKIIFDNFYEASTLLTTLEDGFEVFPNNEEIITTESDMLLMTTTTNANSDEDEKMLFTTTTEAPTPNTIQPEKLTTACSLTQSTKRSNQNNPEVTKIIMIQIVNDTKMQEIQTHGHDTLKANVTKINVGDDNFYIYKATVDEQEMSPQLKEEEADLFHQLALSVVNNAKSIDYLSRRKRTRRKKIFKQKIRRKDKQTTKN
ncbi:hypothetical protein MML48_7g00014347 [Holotrichia oblita]|uniref:Uncharacterized protein n=1 Tax=Holotrichia oblita TaxID=644536 RepID=A0ACB9STE0_HOLOL|nr:hypothetical protein MML48_7g00014347 [Holotrichia oblita]